VGFIPNKTQKMLVYFTINSKNVYLTRITLCIQVKVTLLNVGTINAL